MTVYDMARHWLGKSVVSPDARLAIQIAIDEGEMSATALGALTSTLKERNLLSSIGTLAARKLGLPGSEGEST